MEIKLANYTKYSYNQIIEGKEKGGKFVSFQWILPLPWFTPVRRLSKVYYIEPGIDSSVYALKYNNLSRLLGWWGLPFGPLYVGKSIRLNNNGGIDVTDDIYLNLNEENFKKGFVDLKLNSMKFTSPNKTEINELKKVSKKLIEDNIINKSFKVAYFIDTKENEFPYYLIAVDSEISIELEEIVKKEIYKRFYKQFRYQLICIHSEFTDKEMFLKEAVVV
ncbi:MAG: hypothetical protein HYR91_07620 [Flavobacteriia bacterium]|nr:hypothetical protein [Flavobacteriia bacterium]